MISSRSRCAPAHVAVPAVAVLWMMSLGAGSAAAQPQAVIDRLLPETMLPLQIDEVIVDEEGQLVAIASLGDEVIQVPLELSLVELLQEEDGACGILDLALGPINLDLLGLQVDTSAICLVITAESGEGNLLGNLLCSIAGLLDEGIALEDILANLADDELDALLGGIRDLLNAALDEILAPASVTGVSSSGSGATGPGQGQGPGRSQAPGQQQAAACDILNLSLGAVELDLLGLVVVLDDCEGGPVTVDITAEPGSGNLLGNLLCGVARLLDRGAGPAAVANALRRVADEILALL